MSDLRTVDWSRVIRRLSGALPGVIVEVLPQIDSTNSELMRRVRAGHNGPLLLVAEHQTAGRGRLGRSWASRPVNSLTFSLGLPFEPTAWSGLSLAVGVAVAEALHPGIGLKWPNDLWIDGRKLGGILVETAGFGGAQATRYAVVGVGINIMPTPAEGLVTPPADLQSLWPEADAGIALDRIAAPLMGSLEAFERFGFAPFRARFDVRDVLRDRHVMVSDGTFGTAHGVGQDGALLVHTAAGMKTITSSEVSVRPAA